MSLRRGGLLRDRRGISNAAVAALVSIAVLLLYLQFISTIQGAEVAFWGVFGSLKWLAGVLGYPHLFDEFEKLIRELMGTPFWPITVYMLSLAFMSGILYGTLWGTKGIVGMTTRILAWRRVKKEGKRKIREKNERDYRLWRKGLDDEGPLSVLPKPIRIVKRSKSKSSNQIEKNKTKAWEFQDWRKLVILEWWQIPRKQILTLVEGKLKEMILEGKKLFPTEKSPQGSYIGLAKALGMDVSKLRKAVREERDSMTVESLMKLLDILKTPYEVLTPYIKSVGSSGHKESIVNPKFPIDMYSTYGARLVAAALKDGTINKINNNFCYTNYDPENRRNIIEAVQHVFGEAKYSIVIGQDGREKSISFNSAVIGWALHRAGVPIGSKIEQHFGLPAMIKFGNSTIINAYFEHAIRDDGSREYREHRISISGAHELESKISSEHHRVLEHLPQKKRTLPSGAIVFATYIRDGLDIFLPDELKPAYEDLISKMESEWIPDIIKEEAQIFERTYGVSARIVPREIYKGKLGLRGKWDIRVGGKEDFERIVRLLDSVWMNGGDEEQ